MSIRRPLVPLVLLLLPAVAGHAAEPLHEAWPAGLGGAGPFSRTAVGQFTYDLTADACVLKGDEAVLAYGPGAFSAYAVVATGVADVATCPASGTMPTDSIVTVGAAGLVGHTLRPTGASFQSQVLAMDWATVVRIACRDVDGLPGADVIGLDADGVTFRRRVSGGPSLLPSVAAPSFTAPNAVSDFVLVQWDADAALEVACLTTAGLEVLDADGTPLFAETGAPAGGVLTAFRQVDHALERVAWLTTATGGLNSILVVCDGIGGTEFVDVIAPIGPAGVAALDVNGDGRDDLLVSGTAGHHLLLAFNQGGTPGAKTFSWSAGQFTLTGVSSSPNDPAPLAMAAPAPIDLDGDGDLDALFPVESTPELVRITNTTVAAASQKPALVETLEWEDLAPPAGGGGGELVLSGSAFVHLLVEENPNLSGATHLRLVVWRAEDQGSATDPVAIQKSLVPVPSDPAGWPLALAIGIEEPAYPFSAVYYVELRAIADGSGASAKKAYPPLLAGFSVDEGTIEWLGAEESEPVVFSAVLPPGPEVPPGSVPSSLELGALVEVLDLDGYVIGTVPIPEEEGGPPAGGGGS